MPQSAAYADTTLPRGPALVFGVGAADSLAAQARRLARPGNAVLLVADPGLPAASARIAEALRRGGLRVRLFTDFTGEPSAAQVDAAAALARDFTAELVVGLGGGAALDIAKLAAAVAADCHPCEAYALCARALPPRPLAKLLIPTTAGTGAEATRTAVFATAEGTKVWAWGEGLQAELAILDPLLTVGLPAGLTAATGIDALVHAIEAATNRNRHPLASAPALQAVTLVRRHLARAVAVPDDLVARGGMLLAAWLAGQAIDRAGTGVAHALGHALGTLGKLHHGRAVGLSLAAALGRNAEAAPDAHADVARAFGLRGRDDQLCRGLPDAYAAFLDEVGFTRGPRPAGFDAEALLAATLRPENRPMLEANCRRFEVDELRALCAELLAG